MDGGSSMRIILAEKPSVARDIARVLGATENHKEDGYLAGNGYAVTWAFGHLVTLAEPESIDPKWGKPWTRESLPLNPTTWKYTIRPEAAKQFHNIRKLLNDSSTTEIICATDAGREGELIFRLIYTEAHCKKPLKRLWISSLTDDAIRQGFAQLHDGAEFDALASAAHGRQRADWMWGQTLTRAFTLHNGDLYSTGRVQTPTLAFVVQRDVEIENFVPSQFYELHSSFHAEQSFTARYIDAQGHSEIETRPVASALKVEVDPIPHAIVQKVTQQDKRISPPALFDLVALQKEANKHHGYTAQEALDVTQELYEAKLVTYPRTESRHLPTTMLAELPGVLQSLMSQPVYNSGANAALSRIDGGHKLSKQYVDDGKLTDHHAIIPTSVRPPSLSGKQKNIYDLIALRFIAIFLQAQVKAETEILIDVGKRRFRAFGSVQREAGWTGLYEEHGQNEESIREGTEEDQALPQVAQGQQLAKEPAEIIERNRKPPKPFTDSSLLTAMRNAGKLVDDEQLAVHMKAKGLGTAATRAEIIEKLIRTRYLIRDGKNIKATIKGKHFIEQVFDEIKDPSLTAQWEKRLKEIEDGDADLAAFEHDIKDLLISWTPRVFTTTKPDSALMNGAGDAEDATPCPACKNGLVRHRKTATADFYGCSGYKEGCRFSLPGKYAEKTLTFTAVRQLCSDKRTTSLLKGFKAKSGKKFDARLQLGHDTESGSYRIKLIFENSSDKHFSK
jgi:DNA topoisomerase III